MVTSRSGFPPVFATNRPDRGETVADAILTLFGGMREGLVTAPSAAIATAYLNPGGFVLVAEELEQVDKVRLLLGAEPDPLTDFSLLKGTADRDDRLDRALGRPQRLAWRWSATCWASPGRRPTPPGGSWTGWSPPA